MLLCVLVLLLFFSSTFGCLCRLEHLKIVHEIVHDVVGFPDISLVCSPGLPRCVNLLLLLLGCSLFPLFCFFPTLGVGLLDFKVSYGSSLADLAR